MVGITPEIIQTYALENAIKHKGSAAQGAVLAGLFAEGLKKSEISGIMPLIQKVLKKVNSMSPEEQQKKFDSSENKTSKREIREGLKPLENATKGEVLMRLAPFPSGPLHIGNARNMIINDEYTKMYNGKLTLWFDDTIGSPNKMIEPQAYDLIKEGLDWLGISYDNKILYKSDRTLKYYEYAEELLKKGYLYVCHCGQEEMQDLKAKGIECSCRKLPAETQLKRWKEMATAKMGSMTVRLKTSMSDPDPAFRDRVMFKISDLPHPKTGTKFRVYPSMEFSWGIDDHIFKSTHILRGTDHHMSTRVQDFIRGIFNWKNPESFYNGQLEIKGVKISKSKGTQKIKSGKYIYEIWLLASSPTYFDVKSSLLHTELSPHDKTKIIIAKIIDFMPLTQASTHCRKVNALKDTETITAMTVLRKEPQINTFIDSDCPRILYKVAFFNALRPPLAIIAFLPVIHNPAITIKIREKIGTNAVIQCSFFESISSSRFDKGFASEERSSPFLLALFSA